MPPACNAGSIRHDALNSLMNLGNFVLAIGKGWKEPASPPARQSRRSVNDVGTRERQRLRNASFHAGFEGMSTMHP